MNTIRMPGFSGEASLYGSSIRFRAGAIFAGISQDAVIPQLPKWLKCIGAGVCCATSEVDLVAAACCIYVLEEC